MTFYTISKKNKDMHIHVGENVLRCRYLQKNYQRRTGLLNHNRLAEDEGVVYKRGIFFHTFGMRFPICVVCFNKKQKLLARPTVVPVNSFFKVPLFTSYIFECHSAVIHMPWPQSDKKSLVILTGDKASYLAKYGRFFLYSFLCLALLFLCLCTKPLFAAENLYLKPGKARILDLGKAPLSIHIEDPEIVDAERVGITNTIKIQGKDPGTSKIQVIYPTGEETTWVVCVGNKQGSCKAGDTAFASQSTALSDQEPDASTNWDHVSPLNKTLIKEINAIPGLKGLHDRGRIALLGTLQSQAGFWALEHLVASQPTWFFPAYHIHQHDEPFIVSSLQAKFRLLGENNLRVVVSKGSWTLIGVPQSAVGKHKIWDYVSGLIPHITDGTTAHVGESAVVQMTLHFLEIARSENRELGISPSSLGNLSATLSFPGELASRGPGEPLLQIGPISSFFKLLQQNQFVREIAKPVILTRSGEKASFLAGGEVPLVTAVSNSTATASSVTYKPFGILFQVTPQVQTDGRIWVTLDLEVSQVAEELSYQNIPGFTARKVNTNMILSAGDTAFITGLIQNKDVRKIEKMPFIEHIPILGELLKSRRFQNNHTELWVAITALSKDPNENSSTASGIEQLFQKFSRDKPIDLLEGGTTSDLSQAAASCMSF